MFIRDEGARKALYGVATAVLAVLGVYGLLDETQIAAFASLAASLIAALAFVNTGGSSAQPKDETDSYTGEHRTE